MLQVRTTDFKDLRQVPQPKQALLAVLQLLLLGQTLEIDRQLLVAEAA